MTIGENIRAFRKKKRLSQRELGEKIGNGMSQQQITQYENGTRKPKTETLRRIAEALDTPVQNLLPSEQFTAELDFFDPSIEWVQNKLPDGYIVRQDKDDMQIWIEYPDGSSSQDIPLSEIQNTVNTVMEFFRFTLEKYRRK